MAAGMFRSACLPRPVQHPRQQHPVVPQWRRTDPAICSYPCCSSCVRTSWAYAPFFLHQLMMAAQLRHPAILNHGDPVRVPHGGQPVGDDDGGPSLRELFKGFLQFGLRHAVQCGGRLVQNQHRRVLQEDPGNGNPLLLSAGEQRAPLPHIGVKAVGHGHDVVVDLRQLRRPDDLLFAWPPACRSGCCSECCRQTGTHPAAPRPPAAAGSAGSHGGRPARQCGRRPAVTS